MVRILLLIIVVFFLKNTRNVRSDNIISCDTDMKHLSLFNNEDVRQIIMIYTFSALPTNNRLLQCGTTHGTETY